MPGDAEVLAREPRRKQLNVGKCFQILNVGMKLHARESFVKYHGRDWIDLAKQGRAVACLVQPGLDSTDAGKQSRCLQRRLGR
jgi:hypothetical protein